MGFVIDPYEYETQEEFNTALEMDMAFSKGARHFSPKSAAVGPLKYSPADARHAGVANVAFLDGHAEAMNYKEQGYKVSLRASSANVRKGGIEHETIQ